MVALTPLEWTLAAFVALLAGTIKGAIGFALPLVMISGLSTFLEPRLALAGLLIPVLATNAMQVLRQGLAPAVAAARHHWRYILMVVIAILVAAQFVRHLGPRAFSLVLGIPVVVLSLIQLSGVRVRIPPRWRDAAEWGVGVVSGLLGGLAGTWGPTTVLYLLAIDTPKARQMVVQGVIYGVGSVALVLGHLHSGLLNAQTAPYSALLLIPAAAGMGIGFALQDRMDAERFKRVTLIVLVVAGANMIRRGVMG